MALEMVAVRTLPADGRATRSLRVRNTFIETSAERSPSLERFCRRRDVQTCPSSRIGTIKASLQQEMDREAGWQSDDHDCNASVASAATCETDVGHSGGSSACSTQEACWQAEDPTLRDERVWFGASPCASPVFHGSFVPGASLSVISLADALPSQTEPAYNTNAWHAVAFDPFGAVLPTGEASGAAYCIPTQPPPQACWAGGGDSAPLPLEASAHAAGAVAIGVPHPPSGPAPGTPELPSVGSAGHSVGACKPCAFFHSNRCEQGLNCLFCHACPPDEKKKRRKEKIEMRRSARKAR